MPAAKRGSKPHQHKKSQVQSARRKVAAAQVTQLKQQVMDEVNKQNAPHSSDKKAPIAPEPQFKPSMPGHTPAWFDRLLNRWGHDFWLMGVLAFSVVIMIALLVWGQQESSSPAMALRHIEQALQKGDVAALDPYVDEERVANSLVTQFYGDADFDPQDLPEDLRARLPQEMGADVQIMAKVGLAERLKEDALAYLSGQADMASLPEDLFRRIWSGLSGGYPLEYKGVRNVVSDQKVAKMDVLLDRSDFAEPVALSLRLERDDHGWQLVDIHDIQETLVDVARVKSLSQVEVAATEPADGSAASDQDTAAPAKLSALLHVEGVRKMSGVGGDDEKSVLVTVKLRNIGSRDVKAFSADVQFKDAAGQLMKTFTLSDAVGVTRGMRLEKTWRLPLNIQNRMEKHIYALPQQAIQIDVVPHLVELADGQVVKG